MPPEGATAARPAARREHLRLVERGPMRVVDVALFYGDRSGGIRTYLDAKARFAEATGEIEHHLLVPGAPGIPSVTVNRANGYRLPVRSRSLPDALLAVRPDVVVLHDPFWRPRDVCRVAARLGALTVMVHHGSAELDAHAWPGPARLYARAFRSWLRHAYAHADAVMSACDPWSDTGREAAIPLRFGLHPAFRPERSLPGTVPSRGDHVLYAGRLAREKGIGTLLEAAARSHHAWPLRLVGSGPAEAWLRAKARRLGIEHRLQFRPFVESPQALAREYAQARCVVMPGAMETFGLTAFEAAACGAPVVACETAPSAGVIGPRAQTFPPGSPRGLLAAIERARRAAPDPVWAERFAASNTWERAFRAELEDLSELAGR